MTADSDKGFVERRGGYQLKPTSDDDLSDDNNVVLRDYIRDWLTFVEYKEENLISFNSIRKVHK